MKTNCDLFNSFCTFLNWKKCIYHSATLNLIVIITFELFACRARHLLCPSIIIAFISLECVCFVPTKGIRFHFTLNFHLQRPSSPPPPSFCHHIESAIVDTFVKSSRCFIRIFQYSKFVPYLFFRPLPNRAAMELNNNNIDLKTLKVLDHC